MKAALRLWLKVKQGVTNIRKANLMFSSDSVMQKVNKVKPLQISKGSEGKVTLTPKG